MKTRYAATTAWAAVTLIMASVFAAPVGAVAESDPAILPPVGSLIGQGAVNDIGACTFAPTQHLTLDQGQWEALAIGDQCQLTVKAAWNGSLADGPTEYQGLDLDSGTTGQSAAPASPSSTCKLAEEHYFTYGGGGYVYDRLTHIWSALTYCYDDTYIWGSSTSGSGCAGTNEMSWTWVYDSCTFTSQRLYQNTSSVWSQVRGDFHCSPASSFPCNLSDPDGYYHSLWDQVKAYISGHSTCTHWFSGNVVLGPRSEIVAGCV